MSGIVSAFACAMVLEVDNGPVDTMTAIGGNNHAGLQEAQDQVSSWTASKRDLAVSLSHYRNQVNLLEVPQRAL